MIVRLIDTPPNTRIDDYGNMFVVSIDTGSVYEIFRGK